jgi:L-lysine 2,3-aminomutase
MPKTNQNIINRYDDLLSSEVHLPPQERESLLQFLEEKIWEESEIQELKNKYNIMLNNYEKNRIDLQKENQELKKDLVNQNKFTNSLNEKYQDLKDKVEYNSNKSLLKALENAEVKND